MNKILELAQIYKYASLLLPKFKDCKQAFEAEYAALCSNLNKIKSDKDYYLALSKLINTLNDGHTFVVMPKTLSDEVGYLPFSIICVEGKYYVKASTEKFKSCILKEITAINNQSFIDLLYKCFNYVHNVNGYVYWSRIEHILPFFLKKMNNKIEFKDGSNFSFNLTKTKEKFVSFPQLSTNFKYDLITASGCTIKKFENNILYVKLDTFNDTNLINDCVPVLKKQKNITAVILDVRNNEGGMTFNASKIADLFFDKKFSDSIKQTTLIKGLDLASSSIYAQASSDTLKKWISSGITTQEIIDENIRTFNGETFEQYSSIWGTNKKATFNCPVILLTSKYTFSAGEDFVAMFKSNNRATIIGENTYGSTGTSFHLKLSNDFKIRFCSVYYKLLNGTEFINIGIAPDIFAPISIEDLRNGIDTTLALALNHAQKLILKK